MVWIADGTEPDGSWHKIDAPALGVYERAKFDKRVTQEIDGPELVFNVPREKVATFENKAMDFSKG